LYTEGRCSNTAPAYTTVKVLIFLKNNPAWQMNKRGGASI